MIKKLIVAGLVAFMLLPLLGGCALVSRQLEETPEIDLLSTVEELKEELPSSELLSVVANESTFYVGYRQFYPEWAVVPPRLIGEVLGTTERDILFDPYGGPSMADWAENLAAMANPLTAVIPAGSEYYEVKGYDTQTYLALQNGGNYYLYTNSPKEMPSFPQGTLDDDLMASFAGSPEEAYLQAYTFVSGFSEDFVVLDVQKANIDNIDNLITLVAQYSDSIGCTLLLTSKNYVEARGYLTYESGNEFEWTFRGGSFVYLEQSEIDESRATVDAGFHVAPLFGSGERFIYEKENNAWVLIGMQRRWIS